MLHRAAPHLTAHLATPTLPADIVRVLKDVNLNVVSAEVDTVGFNAVDRFNLTYKGEPLPGAPSRPPIARLPACLPVFFHACLQG